VLVCWCLYCGYFQDRLACEAMAKLKKFGMQPRSTIFLSSPV